MTFIFQLWVKRSALSLLKHIFNRAFLLRYASLISVVPTAIKFRLHTNPILARCSYFSFEQECTISLIGGISIMYTHPHGIPLLLFDQIMCTLAHTCYLFFQDLAFLCSELFSFKILPSCYNSFLWTHNECWANWPHNSARIMRGGKIVRESEWWGTVSERLDWSMISGSAIDN